MYVHLHVHACVCICIMCMCACKCTCVWVHVYVSMCSMCDVHMSGVVCMRGMCLCLWWHACTACVMCRSRHSPCGLQPLEAQADDGCPTEHAAQVQGLDASGRGERHTGQDVLWVRRAELPLGSAGSSPTLRESGVSVPGAPNPPAHRPATDPLVGMEGRGTARTWCVADA